MKHPQNLENFFECLLAGIKPIDLHFIPRIKPHGDSRGTYIVGIDLISKTETGYLITTINDQHKSKTHEMQNIPDFVFNGGNFFEQGIIIHTDICSVKKKTPGLCLSTLIVKCTDSSIQIYRAYRRNRFNKFLQEETKLNRYYTRFK